MCDDDLYPCVGICMVDPDSGYCLGCGRPPLDSPSLVAEAPRAVLIPCNSPEKSVSAE